MILLEKILYPSNKFALAVYVAAAVILGILSYITHTDRLGLWCAGLGFVLGWTAHVLYVRSRALQPGKTTVDISEFKTYEQKLEAAKAQLHKTVV